MKKFRKVSTTFRAPKCFSKLATDSLQFSVITFCPKAVLSLLARLIRKI